MNDAEELGKLTEQGMRALVELSKGTTEEAVKELSQVADALYQTTLSLTDREVPLGVVLHWAVDAASALGIVASTQADMGDAESAVHSLGKVSQLLGAIDLKAMESLNAGRCEHKRITFDDHKCRRSPCS